MGATGAAGPTGTVLPWAGASTNPPAGYLMCDGQAVSRSTYSDLFAVIGTTYGAGNGSSTFNVPNMRGRVPVGADPAQWEFNPLGREDGFKTHTLKVEELPAHQHRVRLNIHHTDGELVSGEAIGAGLIGQGGRRRYSDITEPAGSGWAHPNLQPYIVLRYLIKT